MLTATNSPYAQELLGTATPELTSMYVIAKEGLDIRTEPSASGEVVDTLAYGTKIGIQKVMSETVDGITDYWWRVWYAGRYSSPAGYVFGGYLSPARPADMPPILVGVWYSDRNSYYVWSFGNKYDVAYGAWQSETIWYGNWSLSGNILTIPKQQYWDLAEGSSSSGFTVEIKVVNTNYIEFYHQDGSVEKLFRKDAFGKHARRSNLQLSLTLPNNVTSIAGWEFAYNGLASVTLPASLTSMDAWAFAYNELTSVVIPDSVTFIGACAFRDNQLKSVVIGKGITSIGTNVFTRNRLTSVVIPNNVNFIGTGAFSVNQLTSVVIPNCVISIGAGAFAYNQLTSVFIQNGVTSIGEHAFSSNRLASVVIPNSVTVIEGWAFSSNRLTSVVIPNSVTAIEGWAFYNNRLTSIIIPNSVISIGAGAFSCNQLTSVMISDSVKSIGSMAFSESYVIYPNGKRIGNRITSITIGSDVLLDQLSFDNGFVRYYNDNEKKAGTYVLKNDEWSMQ
jgi:hypothetical protein